MRAVTDRNGKLQGIIGMLNQPVPGTLIYEGMEIPFLVKGNEELAYRNGGFVSRRDEGIVHPAYR
ncbi:hypothetical protein D3C73_1589270 [compost metagenome]